MIGEEKMERMSHFYGIDDHGGQQEAGGTAPRQRRAARAPQAAPKRRRRRGRNTIAYALLVLITLVGALVLCLTVFFKVNEITISGTNRYARDELIQSAGIAVGDNLLRMDANRIEEVLVANYPYIESVTVKKAFPPAVQINISEAVPMANIVNADQYVLISTQGRILETGLLAPIPDVPVVNGVGTIAGKGGEKMDEALWENVQMLQYVSKALETIGFSGVDNIDLSDRLDIVFTYENRIQIHLGSEGEMEKKLAFAKRVIEEELEPTFEGVLDASNPGQLRARPSSVLQTPGESEEAAAEDGAQSDSTQEAN